jgi:hypothetical protein
MMLTDITVHYAANSMVNFEQQIILGCLRWVTFFWCGEGEGPATICSNLVLKTGKWFPLYREQVLLLCQKYIGIIAIRRFYIIQ